MTTNSAPLTGCPVHDYPFEAPTVIDPPPLWTQLRQECPIADIRLSTGDQAVLLTRHADVKATLADPRFTRELDPAKGAARRSEQTNNVTTATGPGTAEDHLRWRRLLSKSFTVKRVNELRPHIAEITQECVADLRRDGKPGNLSTMVGFPVPVRVICELLGVPNSDRDRFSHWSDLFLSLTKYTQAEVDAGMAEFVAYIRAHVEAKRADPGDDLISELTVIRDADGPLSDEDLVRTAMGILVAGHETTANMISKMVAMLLADRSRWETLLADRGLIRSAVEEALRMDANHGFGMPRFITEDLELASGTIKAGTTVINSIAAANRDPEVFADPERMDLARTANTHLAFGAGPHSCLGQALARTELQVVLEVLLTELPTVDLAVPVEKLARRTGMVVAGLTELPVTW